MLSHSSIVRFDSRFTAKFFENFNTAEASDQLSSINFSRLKKDAFRTLLLRLVGNTSICKIYINNLLDCLADFFGFEKFQQPTEIPFDMQTEFDAIKNSILSNLKQEFTLEYLLYYILQKKLSYAQKIKSASAAELPKVLEDIYNMLDAFGPDPDFIRSTGGTVEDYDFEQFSNLLISLMYRLAQANIITLNGAIAKPLNENATAYVIPNCNTLTLIYVISGNKRKSLISFLREGKKAHCEKVFPNVATLHELFSSMSLSDRERIWLNAFRLEKLVRVFQTPVEFANITKLLPDKIREEVMKKYAEKSYLHLDNTFVPSFFAAVSSQEGSEVSELLTRVRRSIFVKIMKIVCQENNFNDNRGGYGLTNIILNYYADELGLIKTVEPQDVIEDESMVEKAALVFKHKVETIFNLQYFIEFLYTNKLKNSLGKLLKDTTENNYAQKLQEIQDLFDFYGNDGQFRANIFFDEEAGCDGEIVPTNDLEIELRSYLTLVKRFDNNGFINTDFQQKLVLDADDFCYIFPGNGVLLAYVEDKETGTSYPLVNYFFKQGNDVGCEILLRHPYLLPVLNYFPGERRDRFYQQNFEVLHLLINDVDVFLNILPKLSAEQRIIIFVNINSEFLLKFLQNIAQLVGFLSLVPDQLRDLVAGKLPVNQVQNVLLTQQDFIFYIHWLSPNSLLDFISKLDCDYLQNLFPGKESLKILISALSEYAISPMFEKFGNAYLKIYLPRLNDLYDFARTIPPQAFRYFFSVFCADVLREYFADSSSLALISYIQGERLSFISKLINLTCGAYEDLFVNIKNLQLVLLQVGSEETALIESFEINYAPSVTDCNHLITILKNFKSQVTMLRFCQQFDENRFSTIITEFSHLQRIFNLLNAATIVDFFKSYDSEFFAKLITSPLHIEALLSQLPLDSRKTIYDFIDWQPWFQKLVPDREAYVNYMKSLSSDNQSIFSSYESKVNKVETEIIATKVAEIEVLECRVAEIHRVYATFNHNNFIFAARELSRRMSELAAKIALIPEGPFEVRVAAHSLIFMLMINMFEGTFEKYLTQSCNGFFCKHRPSELIRKMNNDSKNFHFLRLSGLLLNDLYHELPSLPVNNGDYYRKILKNLVNRIEKPENYNNLTTIGSNANGRVTQRAVKQEEERVKRRLRA